MPVSTEEAQPQALTDASLPLLVRRIHEAIAARRGEIDDLNVFPVPDGDTGTNMTLTARAVVDAVDDMDADDDLHDLVVRSAMRAARGNSGVILSQVLRGLVEAIDAATSEATDRPDDGAEPGATMDGPATTVEGTATLADALRRARDLAYDAVAEPVEGTILTAISVAADAAAEAEAEGAVLDVAATRVRRAVHEAVEATRDQLDVLRKAGVVDAGARGFELMIEALDAHVSGLPFVDDGLPPAVRRSRPVIERETGSLEYRFEVQYLLDVPDDGSKIAPALRDRLERLGDSVVVVAAGELLSVHVHTNDVGGAIEAGLDHGRPSQIDVSAFADQIAAREARDRARDQAPRPLGCVAVLPGPGLRRLAEEHGAMVVHGQAGDLPTVADLLDAAAQVQADRVVILPGHVNAVPTAHQAVRVAAADGGPRLEVVDAADTPPRVLAALSVCDPTGINDETVDLMAETARDCRSGEVVAAVRDADTPLGQVRAGQQLAVVDGEVVAISDDPLQALRQLVDEVVHDGCEVVSLICGRQVTGDERDRATATVRDGAGGAEVEVIDGGQGPARYLVGVE